jgi:hypothetical protein
MPFDVFVSYRWVEPDQSWVRQELVPSLKAAGLKVFLDVEDFVPGRDLIAEMTRATTESRRTVCVITPQYFEDNKMVAFESLMARRLDPSGSDSRLIPLMFRNADLPEWLRGPIPVDWTSEQERPREWRRLLLALGSSRLDVPHPGSAPNSVLIIDQPAPERSLMPSFSWEPVNPLIIRRVLTQAITILGLAVGTGLLAKYPTVLNSVGLSMPKPEGRAQEVRDALTHSIWCGLGSFLASLLLWAQLMDTQFVLSLARVLLFASVLGLLCAAVSCIPNISPSTHGLIFTLFIAAGSIYYFVFGIAKYYWTMRKYGDVAAECLIFVLFLYILRRPLMMLLGG